MTEKETNLTTDLYKVMQPEIYKGIPLKNVLGRWQYGIMSFNTKEELMDFIDTLKWPAIPYNHVEEKKY